MKTIFKILSLIMILSLSSCDRPLEDTDYLNNRTPLVAFQGAPDVIFLEEGAANTYEVFVGISAPIDNPVSYVITNDASSQAVEGTHFVLDGNFTIAPGTLSDSFSINIDYDGIEDVVTTLFLNLTAEGDLEIGGNNQFDLTIIKP